MISFTSFSVYFLSNSKQSAIFVRATTLIGFFVGYCDKRPCNSILTVTRFINNYSFLQCAGYYTTVHLLQSFMFIPRTYSHLKNFTAIMLQITAISSIKITAPVTLSVGSPSVTFFSIFIPCVNGRTFTIFCIKSGITSYGRVAPEKILWSVLLLDSSPIY